MNVVVESHDDSSMNDMTLLYGSYEYPSINDMSRSLRSHESHEYSSHMTRSVFMLDMHEYLLGVAQILLMSGM